jgi:hypothetical protein
MRRLAVHFGAGEFGIGSGGQKLRHRLGQIVKERRYLADNISCSRLSDLERAVKHKARGGRGGLGNDSCQACFVES